MSREFAGRCHCGAIGFRYRTALDPQEWAVRACQCTFCRAHHACTTSDAAACIDFSAADPDSLVRYRFGLKTADFLLCRSCGVYIGAVIATGAGAFGIVNLRALDAPQADLAGATPISYDGEDAAGRIGRREQRWARIDDLPE